MSAQSIADWKSALLTLNDGPFFDLMRGYLGDIKTPFNKQKLVEELSSFLGKKEIQEMVAYYLDATDRRVIAALHRLGDPSAADLSAFFDGELSFADIYSVLLNLEERLIVFRYEDGGQRRLSLNPLLAPILDPIKQDETLLFRSEPRAGLARMAPEGVLLTGPFLAAVVSFLYRRKELFKADGSIRKKAADEASAIFPFEAFVEAVGSLRALGVVTVRTAQVRVDDSRLGVFGSLSASDLPLYLASALCVAEQGGLTGLAVEVEDEALVEGEPSQSFSFVRTSRERITVWARLLRGFLDSLDPSLAYAETTLLRILDIQERARLVPRRRHWDSDEATDDSRFGVDPAAFRRSVLHALERTGCLERLEGDTLAVCPAAISASSAALASSAASAAALAPASTEASASALRPCLTIDSTFTALVYPEMPIDDAFRLARYLDIREAGTLFRYELSRESSVRAFDRSIPLEEIAEDLKRVSGQELPQNIRWSLSDWYSRYSSVSLHRGTVLVVAEERRYLMETETLKALIQRELAPGVYLLSVAEESEAYRALERAGVDIIAQPHPRAAPSLHESHALPPLVVRAPLRTAQAVPTATASGARRPEDELFVRERLAALHQALDRKGLPREQKDALASRIDHRVILSESQLIGAAVRYEKLEAKGLDYVGKVRVAEQAISTLSLVEIFWRGPKGEPNHALGAPYSLDKASGEVELVLDTVPRAERIRVSMGKISLLRRIKRSIFGE